MTDNDELDLQIHRRIDNMIEVFCRMRTMTRSDVIAELCNGDNKFEHGIIAIAEMFNLSRHEINTRISAFIEAEKEEEAERISRMIADACSREDAA